MVGIRDQLHKLAVGLEIDKDELDSALMRQPQLYLEVSELVATAIAHRDYLKEELAQIDARLSKEHRQKIEKTTGKATESQVAQAVAVDPQHVKAFEKFNNSKQTADLAAGLKDAFHQRRYMLQELCGLFVASYFQSDSMMGAGKVNEYRAEKNRNAMAEKRNIRKRE